jgi:hypothetical protein
MFFLELFIFNFDAVLEPMYDIFRVDLIDLIDILAVNHVEDLEGVGHVELADDLVRLKEVFSLDHIEDIFFVCRIDQDLLLVSDISDVGPNELVIGCLEDSAPEDLLAEVLIGHGHVLFFIP